MSYWGNYLNILICTTHILIRRSPKMKWWEFSAFLVSSIDHHLIWSRYYWQFRLTLLVMLPTCINIHREAKHFPLITIKPLWLSNCKFHLFLYKSEIEAKYEQKMRQLREELELRRKTEIHEIEERKNSQINTLMRNHEKAFSDIKNYYNDITLNNLALINSLKVSW